MPKIKEQQLSEINLLPQEGFIYTTAGRILNWVLSTFRYLIIVTELIVLAAFFSRFWFDAKNSDLSESIEEKQNNISSYSEFERNYRSIQERFGLYDKILSTQKPYSNYYNYLTSYLPPDVYLDTISVNNNGITASGFTPNELSVLQFSINIDSQKEFKNTNISSFDIDERLTLFKFSVASALEENVTE